MISSIIDIILLGALAGTSGAVLLMYRRLQRFDALQNAAAKEFARSSEALDRAREAMSKLSDEGGEMALTLVNRLNEARMVMNDIDEATMRTRGAYVEIAEFERSRPPVPTPVPQPMAEAEEAPAEPTPLEVVEDETSSADEDEPAAGSRRSLPAAIRIRDAARARIAEARQKAVDAQGGAAPRAPRPAHKATGAPRPTPMSASAPEGAESRRARSVPHRQPTAARRPRVRPPRPASRRLRMRPHPPPMPSAPRRCCSALPQRPPCRYRPRTPSSPPPAGRPKPSSRAPSDALPHQPSTAAIPPTDPSPTARRWCWSRTRPRPRLPRHPASPPPTAPSSRSPWPPSTGAN